MNKNFVGAMRNAVRSIRAYNVGEATRIIQAALTGRSAANDPDTRAGDPPSSAEHPSGPVIDQTARIVEPGDAPDVGSTYRPTKPLGDVVQILRTFRQRARSSMGAAARQQPSPAMPEGAQFLSRTYACAAGARDYKLYIPASAPTQPRGLVVMLHGCKQNPDDFAIGTDMNALAETHGLIIAYPAQAGLANALSCWNWFKPEDQVRDGGEPEIIAGITRELTSTYGLERHQVFIAGLSAGGAMAMIMGETYPDLFAAMGIHSGLAYASAHDVVSAFAVMRGDEPSIRSKVGPGPKTEPKQSVRLIVFQGTQDKTVHPSNADRIITAARSSAGDHRIRQSGGQSNGGQTYARTTIDGTDGMPLIDYWLVEGAGHAWFGGQPGGSYTDPLGPDASGEMVQFFLKGV